MAAVSRDMQNAIPTNFDLNYRGLSGQGSPAGTSIIQNLSVVTPKALSEKNWHEFRNLSRKLALEFKGGLTMELTYINEDGVR